jgi:hypothetical protein
MQRWLGAIHRVGVPTAPESLLVTDCRFVEPGTVAGIVTGLLAGWYVVKKKKG